jgi:hypothetical protein
LAIVIIAAADQMSASTIRQKIGASVADLFIEQLN